MVQWVKNPTSIHEDVSPILGLTQWVKDLVLLQAAVWVTDASLMQHFCGCDIGWQLQLQVDP